jgi:hypothetical protein
MRPEITRFVLALPAVVLAVAAGFGGVLIASMAGSPTPGGPMVTVKTVHRE